MYPTRSPRYIIYNIIITWSIDQYVDKCVQYIHTVQGDHLQYLLRCLFSPQVLNEMTDLLSSCRNYDNYRQAYSRCAGFKIPILGVHLKDLISVNEAMSDYVEDYKVNVQKLQALYNHINELIQLQQITPQLDANKDLVHLLTVSTHLGTQ